MAIDHYSELFSINILHEFYADGLCYDFSLEPTETCKSLLKGHRLITKETGNGLSVIAPCDVDDKPLISIADNKNFSFLMKLETNELDGFTDLPSLSENCIYLFDNEALNEVGVSELSQSEIALTDIERSDYSHIFALIKIHVNNSVPSTLGESSTFNITFIPKKEIWKYYLVVADNAYDWSIIDGDEELNVLFTETNLNQDEPVNDNVAGILKAQFPDNQRFLFTSEQSITYQSDGRKNLQLKKDEDTIIEHLPNPSFLDSGVRIIKIF